ncbi:MAG: hypothetical protein P4M00_24920 [Azospirillaceae bacterium]|nr:hypothetical protein [Azospirillaceae bacterium]
MRRIVLLFVLSLAACATPNCDPETAGFVGGLGNAMSGCYQTNEDRLRQDLAAARQQVAAAMAAAQARRRDAADAQFDALSMSARLANLAQANAEIRRKIEAARARRNSDQGRVTAAQEQLDQLEHERAQARQSGNAEALDENRRKIEALEQFATSM